MFSIYVVFVHLGTHTMKVENQPKILITGANGYLGSNLALHLCDQGLSPILSDRAPSALIQGLEYRSCDFLELDQIRSCICDVDFIYFCTGKTGNSSEALNDPAAFVSGNELTLVNLLSCVKDLKQKPRIIFPSTRLLYKGGSEEALNEEAPLSPKSLYSSNKVACENYLRIFAENFGIEYTIFRISLPYSSRISMEHVSYGVMAYLLKRAKEGQELQVFGDGSQLVSLVHIEDLSEILVQGGMHPDAANETFNIGGPDTMRMQEVLELIAAKYRVSLSQIGWPDEMKSSNQGHLPLSSAKIVGLLNYQFKQGFRDWIGLPEEHSKK